MRDFGHRCHGRARIQGHPNPLCISTCPSRAGMPRHFLLLLFRLASLCFVSFRLDSYHTGGGLDMVPQFFSLWPQMRCKVSPCPGLLHFELGKHVCPVEMRERSRRRATPEA